MWRDILGYYCEMQDLLMVFLYDRHFFFTLSMNLVNNCTMCNSLMLSRINYFIVINFSDQKFSAWANTFFFFTKRKNTQYSYYIYIYIFFFLTAYSYIMRHVFLISLNFIDIVKNQILFIIVKFKTCFGFWISFIKEICWYLWI